MSTSFEDYVAARGAALVRPYKPAAYSPLN
jgi:hypothetical protein